MIIEDSIVMFSVVVIRCMAPRIVEFVLVPLGGIVRATWAAVGVTMPLRLNFRKNYAISRT